MRNTTTQWVADSASSHFVDCHLVELLLDSGPVRLCDLKESTQWAGYTWAGIGSLGGIEPIRANASAEVIGLRLTLSGVPDAAISLVLAENYTSREVNVYHLRFSKSDYQPAESVPLWRGLLSNMSLTEDTQEGVTSRSVVISTEGKNVLLNRALSRRSNHEDHLAQHPTDGFFKKVNATANQEVVWPGKKAQALYA